MSNIYLKNLLNEIKKLASPPPLPPGVRSENTNISPKTTYRNPQIEKMQNQLIDLSRNVTSQLNVQDLSSDDTREQQRASSRDSFGAFITKHYLRNSDVPGVEFDPNPKALKIEDKKPGDPTRLSVVMDTMKRIGDPATGEKFADGVWGPRTNAALKNSYAFAQAMLKLAHDFNISINSFTNKNLIEMKELIPDNEKDISSLEKIKATSTLINYLIAIQKMYNEIKSSILENPQHRAYIEGDKPYLSYQKPGLTTEQLNSIKNTFSQGFNIPIGSNTTAKIEIGDLLNLDSLNNWIKKFPDNKLDPYNVLTLVSNQLSQRKS